MTYSPLAHDPTFWRNNLTVTANAEFYLLFNRSSSPGECTLTVRHVRAHGGFAARFRRALPEEVLRAPTLARGAAHQSRVRVDSLALQTISDREAAMANKRTLHKWELRQKVNHTVGVFACAVLPGISYS